MSDEAPHPTPRPRGAGAVLLILLAWLLVLLAGLALVLVLPFVLVLTAMGGEPGGPVWPIYIWVPAVFVAGFATIVGGLAVADNPRPLPLLLLAVVAFAAFLSYPPFWLWGL